MYQTSSRPAPLDFQLPPTQAIYNIDRRKERGHSRPLSQPHLPSNYTQLHTQTRDGLRTPPADDMSTAYQRPQHGESSTVREASCTRTAAWNSRNGYSGATHSRTYSTLSQPPLNSSASTLKAEVQLSRPAYSQPTSPQIPSRLTNPAATDRMPQTKTSSSDAILPSLQIPDTINNSGGSLAEFAAQITCLFWFEPTSTLESAERMRPGNLVQRLRNEAIPSTGFKKWVVTILTTTQVTQNVILLALLFIYRLKKINPAVKGRSGSEYRLLTVALMLGNKFLDDNTYTNKTWAEVSGISVTEIHVMEVEFLSNMRYSLLATKDEWAEWQEKLGCCWLYCDAASKAPLQQYSILNPTLPSPPTSLQSSPPLVPDSGVLAINSNASNQWPELQPLSISRKRSFEGDSAEPAAKRVTRPSTTVPTPYNSLPPRIEAPRLPVPNLTISTGQANGYHGPGHLPQSLPVLPPLSAGRAMASVYPPTSQSWTPQLPMLTPTGLPQQTPGSAGGYSTPTRRHSPHSVQELLSMGSSPTVGHFPHYNPGHISPTAFVQRSSPYKPVRHFDTLLYPPPSASMRGAYSANVNQMQYQPLGKKNDHRQGMIPEYAPRPVYQWDGPTLRQPNFDL